MVSNTEIQTPEAAEAAAKLEAWDEYDLELDALRKRLRDYLKSGVDIKQLAAEMFLGVSTLERFIDLYNPMRRPIGFTLWRIELILDKRQGELRLATTLYQGELTIQQKRALAKLAEPLRSWLESRLRRTIAEKAAGEPNRVILRKRDEGDGHQFLVAYDADT